MAPKSKVSGFAGSARISRLSGPALAATEKHGKRTDLKGPARAVIAVPPVTSTGLNLADLHEAHIEGAAVHKSKTKALHMLVQFPTELVDGENPDLMLKLARKFATSVFGDAAIFGDRIDRDEKSRHVVDLFLAPKYEKKTKHTSKLAISTTKHLKDLAAKYERAPTLRGQGQALQDAFADFLRIEGYTAVKRGQPKKLPGNDRLEPEELEAERLDELAANLIDNMKPPTRLDLVRPDAWFANFLDNARSDMEPLLLEASKTAAERVRRIEAEKRASEAENAASEAYRRAQEAAADAERKADQRVRDREAKAEEAEAKAKMLSDRYAHMLMKEAVSRNSEAEAPIREAEDRRKRAEQEAARLRAENSRLNALLDLFKRAIEKFVPQSIRDTLMGAVNAAWAKHDANPDRGKQPEKTAAPEPKSKPDSGSRPAPVPPRSGPGMG